MERGKPYVHHIKIVSFHIFCGGLRAISAIEQRVKEEVKSKCCIVMI
jgi:hypothetical protein